MSNKKYDLEFCHLQRNKQKTNKLLRTSSCSNSELINFKTRGDNTLDLILTNIPDKVRNVQGFDDILNKTSGSGKNLK